ncbi:hypothetical protein AOLI_G00031280 [Acnodon oligacanthus]
MKKAIFPQERMREKSEEGGSPWQQNWLFPRFSAGVKKSRPKESGLALDQASFLPKNWDYCANIKAHSPSVPTLLCACVTGGVIVCKDIGPGLMLRLT